MYLLFGVRLHLYPKDKVTLSTQTSSLRHARPIDDSPKFRKKKAPNQKDLKKINSYKEKLVYQVSIDIDENFIKALSFDETFGFQTYTVQRNVANGRSCTCSIGKRGNICLHQVHFYSYWAELDRAVDEIALQPSATNEFFQVLKEKAVEIQECHTSQVPVLPISTKFLLKKTQSQERCSNEICKKKILEKGSFLIKSEGFFYCAEQESFLPITLTYCPRVSCLVADKNPILLEAKFNDIWKVTISAKRSEVPKKIMKRFEDNFVELDYSTHSDSE